MHVGVLGTGVVGRTLGTRLVALGHRVTMGSRRAGGDQAVAWAAAAGELAAQGTFADAAAPADLVVNATAGTGSLAALGAAGAEHLAGKVVLDVANALDVSAGMPPTLAVCNTDSLGEQIQRAFPDARVVKALNTVNCDVMVDPSLLAGHHTMFLAGDDDRAKDDVRRLLESFGWPPDDLVDLGGIGAARGMEMYLPLWLRLWQATGSGRFNVLLVRER
ncbi:MAG: NADPH-dependent F420 reductase [Acidimicrobiia bacterium]